MNNLRRLVPVFIVLFLSVMVVPTFADNYTITFTKSSLETGPTPTGSFTYSDSAGFSNFSVVVGADTFDVTSLANNFPDIASTPASCGLTSSELGFAYFSGQTTCLGTAGDTYGVFIAGDPGFDDFTFFTNYVVAAGPSKGMTIKVNDEDATIVGGEIVAEAGPGAFSITDTSQPTATAEPGDLSLLLPALLGLGLLAAGKQRFGN